MTGDERVKLVNRLREQAAAFGQHRDDRQRWADAADEIERLSGIIVCERIDTANLRSQLAAAQEEVNRLMAGWVNEQDETRALRAQLAEAQADRNEAEGNFYYAMAKWANKKWESDVRHRPKANIYRAGMDKAWRYLEQYCLEQREAIDAARKAEESDDAV